MKNSIHKLVFDQGTQTLQSLNQGDSILTTPNGLTLTLNFDSKPKMELTNRLLHVVLSAHGGNMTVPLLNDYYQQIVYAIEDYDAQLDDNEA